MNTLKNDDEDLCNDLFNELNNNPYINIMNFKAKNKNIKELKDYVHNVMRFYLYDFSIIYPKCTNFILNNFFIHINHLEGYEFFEAVLTIIFNDIKDKKYSDLKLYNNITMDQDTNDDLNIAFTRLEKYLNTKLDSIYICDKKNVNVQGYIGNLNNHIKF